MRARRREINIFNMSLLDILCGALGAFCFMMLVALPYYIPPGSGMELRKAQAETERLLVALGNLKEKMPDQKSVEEMEALMRQLEAQVKALQGRVNILTAEREEMLTRVKKLADENEDLRGELSEMGADNALLQLANKELKAKSDGLTETNKRLTTLLERKKTFVVAAHATEFIDLMLTDELPNVPGNQGPYEAFDRWLQGEMETSMLHSFLSVSGSSAEIRTEVNPEKPQKIFVKLNVPARTSGTTQVDGAIFTAGREDQVMRWPAVRLSQERFWALVGTLTTDQNLQLKFTEATQEERDAEWRALSGSAPPVAPTPTPPPTAEALKKAEAIRAQRQEIARKFTRLLQISRANSAAEATEALALAEELIKDLPPGEPMRRQAETMRERILSDRARAAVSPAP